MVFPDGTKNKRIQTFKMNEILSFHSHHHFCLQPQRHLILSFEL